MMRIVAIASVLLPLAALSPSEVRAQHLEVNADLVSELVVVDDGSFFWSQNAPENLVAMGERADTILVPINNSRQLGLLDEQGLLIETLGRPGEGPGEFRRIVRVGVSDGRPWAYDPSVGRVTSYDARFEVTTAPISGPNTWALPDVRGVYWRYRSIRDDAGIVWQIEEQRFDGTMVPRLQCRTTDAFQSVEVAGVRAQVPLPWGSRCASSVNGETTHVAVLQAGGAEVQVLELETGDLRTFALNLERVALTDAFIDDWLLALSMEAENAPPGLEAAIRSDLDPPDELPVAVDVRLVDPESFWVALGADLHRRSWVRVDDGSATASVRLPREGRLLHATRSHLWLLERGEFDVPHLVRYRVE